MSHSVHWTQKSIINQYITDQGRRLDTVTATKQTPSPEQAQGPIDLPLFSDEQPETQLARRRVKPLQPVETDAGQLLLEMRDEDARL